MAQDDIDGDFEEGVTEEFAEDVPQEAKPAKKKSGGALMGIVLVIVLIGGGIVAAPFLGIALPFSIPGLTPAAAPQDAAAPVDPNAVPPATVAELPPQPAVPASEPLIPGQPVQMASGAEAEVPAVDGAPQVDLSPPSIDSFAVPVASISQPTDIIAPAPPETDPLAVAGLPEAPVTDVLAADPLPPPDVQMDVQGAAPVQADPLAPATGSPVDVLTQMPEQQPVIAQPTMEQPLVGQPLVEQPGLMPQPQDLAQPQDPSLMMQQQTPTATAAVSDETVQKLEQKISGLETTIATMQQNTVSKSDFEQLKAMIGSLEQGLASNASATKAANAVKKAKSEVENYRNGIMPDVVKVERPQNAASSPSVSRRIPVKAAGTSWVLKSAKPGTAWLSQRGSSELKTVSVGDTVTGLGKITMIAKDSAGRWMVNGTKGHVAQ